MSFYNFPKCHPFSIITYVPIVSFMQTLDAIAREYHKWFPLWLIIFITVCSMLVDSFLIVLCIWQKCDKEYNQCVTRMKEKSLKDCSTSEMVLIALGGTADFNVRNQKALEETDTNPRAYENYLKRKYSNASFNIL